MKFQQIARTVTDKNINIKLRLKLFESVVTPTALYGLETCSLTHYDEERLDIAERRMLRRIVGWCPFEPEETWSERGNG